MKEKEREFQPKEIARDLISMQKFLPGFLKLGKDYNDIIEYYLSLDLDNEDTHYPSINELQVKLGISYSVLRRKMFQLYEDLSHHDNLGIDFSIKKIEYVFWLEYFDKRAYITINDLPIIPRVGEEIRFPFFRAMVGTEYFHVRKIDHEFDDTKQSINIILGSGEYNLFWHFKKDEEYERGNISWEDHYSSKDYQLKRKLGLRG
jgi:hypothetical protein